MDLDSWGVLIVAAIAHDVAYGDLQLDITVYIFFSLFFFGYILSISPITDHPGVTNSFLVKSSDSLCVLYGDISTLEYHHFTTLCNILHRRNNDIFVNVTSR